MPPFSLGESYGDAGMGVARLFGFCVAFLLVSPLASAANIIDLGPSDYRSWGSGSFQHHPNGINAKFGQTIRMPPMNTNLTVTRNPVVPYGSIANGAKNFVRVNPASVAASAAITALMLGLDWVFDDALDSWMKEGELVPIPPDPSAYRWVHQANQRGPYFSDPTPACEYVIEQANMNNAPGLTYTFEYLRWTSATSAQCIGNRIRDGAPNSTDISNGGLVRLGNSCPAGSSYNTELRMCVMPSGLIHLDNSDWLEFESSLPYSPPSLVGDAAGDLQDRQGAPLPGYTDLQMEGPTSTTGPASTTTTTTETGDNIVTSTTTTTYYNYGDTTITTTNTTTSTTYQNGQQTGETVTTETPGEIPVDVGGGGAGDWPGFCDWATTVCDWFNWTQEDPPPEQDLPAVIDDDFYQEKEISFGAKSCPPDHQIDLAPFLSTSVAVSFQPLCDFAGLIYYMVMAASYIIAAYITIGVARNG